MTRLNLPRPRALAPLDLLGGLKILDLTTSIAGPSATQILADLGASIVKIERAGSGDDSRAWGPPFLEGQSLWFAAVNRNKQSVALNLGHAGGYDVFTRLVACADAVIINATPKTQAHLKIDYASLSRLKPDLVHVSITGFGLTGPRANLPCYDLIAEGYSGIMDLTGEADGAAQKVGSPAADLLAGSDAAIATIAALLRRQRDGKGCQIDVSMLDSMVRFVSPRVMALLGGDAPPRRSGGRDSVIAIYQVFETADDPMTLALGNDAIWERFWVAVGELEFGKNPRFSSNAGRRQCRPEIVEKIQSILRTQPRARWLATFNKVGVPCGPINSVADVVNDPELLARGMFYEVGEGARCVPQVGLGIQFDGQAEACVQVPPLLGEHTDRVLAQWLALSVADIAALRGAGAIG